MTEWFWVDGERNGTVSPDDRGLNLADGAFETVRVEQGILQLPEMHRNRLARGLSLLGFPGPGVIAAKALRDGATRAREVLAAADGSLRITVTRGSSPRGYGLPENIYPRVILRLNEGLPPPTDPVTINISPIRWGHQPLYGGCKLLARTEQILALMEARRAGYEDAVMLNQEGYWQSTCSGNVFIRVGDTLFTPPVDGAGIAGTRRKLILDLLAQTVGLEAHEEPLTQRLLEMADEAFSCSSLMGVRSIYAVDNFYFDSTAAADYLRPMIHQVP